MKILSSGREVLSDTSCRDYRVNERHTICCDGIVYIRSGFRPACCGSVAYDSEHYLCCGKTIVHRQGRLPRCCGDQVYDAYRQRCQNGYLVDRTGIGSTCCQTYTGWKCCRRGENCCDRFDPASYDRRQEVVDVPGFRPACCQVTSRRERAACCKTATEKAWYLPPCCDEDDVRPLCCIRTNGEWECCTPEEGYCCDGESVPVRPRPRRPGLVPARRPPAAVGVTVSPTWSQWQPPPRRVPEEPRFVTAAFELPEIPRLRPTRPPPRPVAPPRRPRPTAALPRPRPTATRPTAVVARPTTSAPLRVPDCCMGPDRPSCCYTVTRWTTCCLLYKRKRRPRPKPSKQASRRSCCVGPLRPACCYSLYIRDDCCKTNSSTVTRPTSSPTPRPTPRPLTQPDILPYNPPDDEVAPFEGQMASCCSSSSRQECCAYGRRVTGVTPMCCEEEDLQAAMLPDHLSTRILEPTLQYQDYVDYDDSGRVITVIEEDLSCCELSGPERASCCASGYRRNGFLPECCGRELGEELDARGDIPGDLPYMYAADEPSPDSSTSCCNVTIEQRDHCCRAGFLTTEQTFECCQENPPKLDGDKNPVTIDSLRSPTDSPVNSSLMNHTSCCGLNKKEHRKCCLKNSAADCCPTRGLPLVVREQEQTSAVKGAWHCCSKADLLERAECCKNKSDGVKHHPLCCPQPSSSQKKKHNRRHGHQQPLRHQGRKQRHRLRHSIDICEGKFYDRMTQMCCSGRVKLRRGASPKCCGEKVYDAAEFRCCPDDNRVARRC